MIEELSHPCKNTCSGYSMGRDEGRKENQQVIQGLFDAIREEYEQYWKHVDDGVMVIEPYGDCVKSLMNLVTETNRNIKEK